MDEKAIKTTFRFTFEAIEREYRTALDLGYEFCTCAEYVTRKRAGKTTKLVVNRVDMDMSVKKADRLGAIFDRLKIRASFYLRLHAPEYNPFSFENYRIIKTLISSGHELGYHSEIVDESAIWSEAAENCLRRDIDVMNRAFGIRIQGVASHGGMTGLNNLDFWNDRKPADFGLLYEAYDKQPEFNLFQEAFYISDSEWTRWKCYDRGQLVAGNQKSFGEHAAEGRPLIYLLIHSDTYFDRHFYE
ncbi:MAG: hypothetical protein HY549_02185 [Elusimicrobia bacterium]|nr:hypothetical protein [Elusimicrobiota bacterium]